MSKQRLQELAGITELGINVPNINEKEAIRLATDVLIKADWKNDLDDGYNYNQYTFEPKDVNPRLVKYLENLPIEDHILEFRLDNYKVIVLMTDEDDDEVRTVILIDVDNYE